MAERDERLVGVTPAMREGSKMERFEQLFPGRYFDVAIARTAQASRSRRVLACEGLKPVVAIYSTFPAARVRPRSSTMSCCRTCR